MAGTGQGGGRNFDGELYTQGKRGSVHYAWIVLVITFYTLLVAAGVRAAPSVFIKPLEGEFGWHRSSISAAVALSLIAYGFGAPLGGSLLERLGPRKVMVGALALTTLGLLPIVRITALWQLHVLWGIVVGVGTGAIATVLGATVAHRWFRKARGVVVGVLGAASAAGQLVFLPALIAFTSEGGWRTGILFLALTAGVAILPVAWLMRDTPTQMGVRAWGDDGHEEMAQATVGEERRTSLRDAARTRDFWLLAGSFFVCGYTTNGLIGTHLLPHALEHGFTAGTTASALATMGLMNIAGTTASGYLSDRWDNRFLLATYYGFRALSLIALPFISANTSFFAFAVVYGLDWIATVPPTVNLTAHRFGRGSISTLFGWIFCAHMIGAALGAYAGGFFRERVGDYQLAFFSAAVLGFIAMGLSLSITKRKPLLPVSSQAAAIA